MAPVIKGLKRNSDTFESKCCVTAQHRHMLDQVLNLFDIKPDYDLNIIEAGQDLIDVTCKVIRGLKKILYKEHPDIVLVHGDTTTTMAASIAAFYCRLNVGHVEAGLRTGNIYSPWPEEMNRRITDTITNLNFAPTNCAKENLIKEGIAEKYIYVTGNTVIDALFDALGMIEHDPTLSKCLSKMFPYLSSGLKLILVTGHRRENFGEGFENICQAIKKLGSRKDVQIVYPVHLNPNVREPVNRILNNCPNIHLIEPLEYLPFIYLLRRSYLVITDSGGVQEEAPSLGKPVLVMRDTTERPEALDAGNVQLVGTNKATIICETERLLDDISAYSKMAYANSPYGDGKATARILKACIDFFRNRGY